MMDRLSAKMHLAYLSRSLVLALPATRFFRFLGATERRVLDEDIQALNSLLREFDQVFPNAPHPEELQKLFRQVDADAYARGVREGKEAAKLASQLSVPEEPEERDLDPDELNTNMFFAHEEPVSVTPEISTLTDFIRDLATALRPFALQDDISDEALLQATKIYQRYLETFGVPK